MGKSGSKVQWSTVKKRGELAEEEKKKRMNKRKSLVSKKIDVTERNAIRSKRTAISDRLFASKPNEKLRKAVKAATKAKPLLNMCFKP
jgi:hypothetical protein